MFPYFLLMNLLLTERFCLSCSKKGPRKQEINDSPMLGKKKKLRSQVGFIFLAFLFAADTAFPIEKEL